jgi:hypothetical protein
MSTEGRLTPPAGRYSIRSVTRPAVWPFWPGMLVAIPAADADGAVLVRVSTPGGALLRSFAARRQGLAVVVSGIEVDGCACDLRLSTRGGPDGGLELIGDWVRAGGQGAPIPGWIARFEGVTTAARAA